MTHTSDAIADTESLPVIARAPRPDGLVGFEVIGDSMMPTLKPGDSTTSFTTAATESVTAADDTPRC